MGTNLKSQALKDERLKISQGIVEILKSWDHTAEDAIEIMAKTEVELEKMKKVRDSLRRANKGEEVYDQAYEKNLQEIINRQNEIIEVIDQGKKDILKSLDDLGKTNSIRKSYINKNNRPIFINKDI